MALLAVLSTLPAHAVAGGGAMTLLGPVSPVKDGDDAGLCQDCGGRRAWLVYWPLESKAVCVVCAQAARLRLARDAVDTLHDRIHPTSGRLLAARPVRTRPYMGRCRWGACENPAGLSGYCRRHNRGPHVADPSRFELQDALPGDGQPAPSAPPTTGAVTMAPEADGWVTAWPVMRGDDDGRT